VQSATTAIEEVVTFETNEQRKSTTREWHVRIRPPLRGWPKVVRLDQRPVYICFNSILIQWYSLVGLSLAIEDPTAGRLALCLDTRPSDHRRIRLTHLKCSADNTHTPRECDRPRSLVAKGGCLLPMQGLENGKGMLGYGTLSRARRERACCCQITSM
jgi:hypothetical protein